MIINTNIKIKCPKDNHADQKKHGMYISNPNIVPHEVIEGILASFDLARYDNALGIYSYFFTPISKRSLAERYTIKNDYIHPKDGTIFYIQKYIIEPTYELIKKSCVGINTISVMNYNVSNVSYRTFSPEE